MDDNAPYLIAIAKTGSISKAAQHMHVSQPALSQRLKQLEKRLGVTLFDRSCTPVKPTYACEIYLDWARRAVEAEDAMRREISAIANESTRRLQIGTSVPRANNLLPDILEQFHKSIPRCTCFLYEAGMPENSELLFSSRTIDFSIFTPIRPEAPLFAGEPLCCERMLLAAPATWHLPIREFDGTLPVIDPSCLADLPFIMPPGHLKHARIIRGMMDSANVKLHVVLHSCSIEMTAAMVRRGSGVSIMPNTFLFSEPNDKIAWYCIKNCSKPNLLYVIRRADHKASEDEKAFIHLAKDWVTEHPEFALP